MTNIACIMPYEMIAKTLNVTKQRIDIIIKNTMRKVWKKMAVLNPEDSPFELAVTISEGLGINKTCDFVDYFNDYPNDIREKIITDLLKKKKMLSSEKIAELMIRKRDSTKTVDINENNI